MKIVELITGIQVPITNEERDLLAVFDFHDSIEKTKLDEREQHVANQLVNKDILVRRNNEGKIAYSKKI
jgi:hypothetical protein